MLPKNNKFITFFIIFLNNILNQHYIFIFFYLKVSQISIKIKNKKRVTIQVESF